MNDFDILELYKLFLENVPWPVWVEGVDSRVIFLNKIYEQIYNVKLEDVIGRNNEEAFGKEKAEIYDHYVEKCLNTLQPCIIEDKVGDLFFECHMFAIVDKEGIVKGVAGVIIDITERKARELEVQEQKSILRTIIDAVPEAIFYKDKESRIVGCNKNFQDFYKKKGIEEVVGKTDMDLLPDKELAKVFTEQDKEIVRTQQRKYFQNHIIDDEGNSRFEENLKIPVINNGEAWGIVGVSRDITERKTWEEKLKYYSEIDVLTGLYNRRSFEEKLKDLNNEQYLPLGIIMGDVNGLKIVNDTFGHFEGDRLLKEISNVLKTVCGNDGYIFRWGGDEFIILLPNCNELNCEKTIGRIIEQCEDSKYTYIQLSIALGETVKYDMNEDIYQCIKNVEERVYRKKLLDKKSIKSSIMESLRNSLEEKNMETFEHTDRVIEYAVAVGKELKLKPSQLDELAIVAELHDIGKIGIGEEILLKPSALTKEEFEIMKTHTEKGYRIINASSELDNVAKCVLTHHERWDGKGYPLGLKGEEIPLISRIINIVDSYDVMTNERVYKKAMSKESALNELLRCSGTQFEPNIVQCFIEYILRNK